MLLKKIKYYYIIFNVLVVKSPLLVILLTIIYIILLRVSIVCCDSLDWNEQWIQGAPLNKQPDWIKNHKEDPRSLYEQMNGPEWRDVRYYYNTENNDPTYLGYEWWKADSKSDSNSVSGYNSDSGSDTDSNFDYNYDSDFSSGEPYNYCNDKLRVINKMREYMHMIETEYYERSPLHEEFNNYPENYKIYNPDRMAEIFKAMPASQWQPKTNEEIQDITSNYNLILYFIDDCMNLAAAKNDPVNESIMRALYYEIYITCFDSEYGPYVFIDH